MSEPGKIRISDLQAKAGNRPARYLDEFLSAGRIEGDILYIEHAVYSVLRKKYAPKAVVPKLSSAALPARQSPTTQPVNLSGPGTELKKLLSKLGLKPAPNCKCNTRMLVMNQMGIDWCKQHIDTIVGWLKEEADRAKLPFTKIGAKIIVKRAISNARKTSKQTAKRLDH